jgi:hypothetical protein
VGEREKRAEPSTIGDVQIRKPFPQLVELGKIHQPNVHVLGVMDSVILMVSLGRVECFEGHNLGDNLVRVEPGLVELKKLPPDTA